MSPRELTDDSYDAGTTLVDHTNSVSDFPSPMSESALSKQQEERRVQRKTLMLLSRSQGVQTDPIDLHEHAAGPRYADQGSETHTGHAGDNRSETSSLHESTRNPATLSILVEHLAKILAKLRSADIPTLNKRLKKHNLPGDVGHLSRSTMRALEAEVADLRHLFRGMGENASLTKRDSTFLLKLLRDVFSDLIGLQSIVNDVTVDPHVAKKLQRAAYWDEDDASKAKQGAGLGWIAAPITKFFVTPAAEIEASVTAKDTPSRTGRSTERGKLQPQTIKASKQHASTSATTTHVSVEFGGTGIVRRATPAVPAAGSNNRSQVRDTLPPSPRDTVNSSSVPPVPPIPDDSATLRVPKQLHRSKSRANRNELLGIFAGAQRPVSPAGGPWHVVSGPPGSGNPKTLRTTSSTYFGDKTIKPRREPEGRRRLPSAVDAVIDPSAEQLQNADPASIDDIVTASLLERQLRPRGLSDSSIRSTFLTHAKPSEGIVPTSGPAARQTAYKPKAPAPAPAAGGGGILESLSNRFYSFRGGVTSDVSPVNPPPDDSAPGPVPAAAGGSASAGSTPALDTPEVKVLPSTPSPAKPIAVSPSSTSRQQQGTSSQNGFLGMLASSVNADGDPEERVGDMAARFRQASAVPRSLSTSRNGKSWE